MLIHTRGVPDTVDALVFMIGAVFAFALTSLIAFGGIGTSSVPEQNPPAIWGSFHFISVSLAIGVATLVAHTIQSFLAWPLASFSTTFIYLLVLAGEVTLANRRKADPLKAENSPRAG